jgi:hypothetical protein
MPICVNPPSADVIVQLATTASGVNPEAFEIDAYAAFASPGFAAQHIGGNAHSDGTLDALLGVLGYRDESKLSKTSLARLDITKAAK